MNIREAYAKFADDEQCLQYIQQMRWPDGVIRCPQCGASNIKRVERSTEKKGRNKRGWFYLCLEKTCHFQFSPTYGTLFHDTHLPLIVWFQAIALMLNAKKGISAKQLQRDLGIGGYKTAWYLNHRIREAMNEGDIPLLGGVVEIDETYIGGKTKREQRGSRGLNKPKDCVMGIVERGGKVRFRHVGKGNANAETVRQVFEANVDPHVRAIVTDQSLIYPFGLPKEQLDKHFTIDHSHEYVNRENPSIHTNTIESAFSLLKRGIIGSFHKVSIKHMNRYLAEFEYRFNRRNEKIDVFAETVKRVARISPMPYQKLVSEKV